MGTDSSPEAKREQDLSFAAELRKSLPPTIARKDIEKYLGGIISKAYLTSLDSQGKGPKRFKLGKTVCYSRDALVDWLVARAMEGGDQ